MRKSLLGGGLAVAALGLSACGSVTAASLHQMVGTIGSSPYVQIHVTASASGHGREMKEIQDVLSASSVEFNASSPSGDPLSTAGLNANREVIVTVGGAPLLDERVVDGTIYLKFDFSGLPSVSGVKVSSAETAMLQLLLGGRWFSLTHSELAGLLPTAAERQRANALDSAFELRALTAMAHLINASTHRSLGNGAYAESGSLQSLVTALAPAIRTIAPMMVAPTGVKGTYSVTLKSSGAKISGLSFSVTAPNPPNGTGTVSVSASFAHANDPVAAPSGAAPVSPALVHDLLAMVSVSQRSSSVTYTAGATSRYTLSAPSPAP